MESSAITKGFSIRRTWLCDSKDDQRDQSNSRIRGDLEKDNIPFTFFGMKSSPSTYSAFFINAPRFRDANSSTSHFSRNHPVAREFASPGHTSQQRSDNCGNACDKLTEDRENTGYTEREWFAHADDKCALERLNAHTTETSNGSLERDWPAQRRARRST